MLHFTCHCEAAFPFVILQKAGLTYFFFFLNVFIAEIGSDQERLLFLSPFF